MLHNCKKHPTTPLFVISVTDRKTYREASREVPCRPRRGRSNVKISDLKGMSNRREQDNFSGGG